jgi:hypothetical protein
MPNQDLTDQQARDVFEFMRKNDGKISTFRALFIYGDGGFEIVPNRAVK